MPHCRGDTVILFSAILGNKSGNSNNSFSKITSINNRLEGQDGFCNVI